MEGSIWDQRGGKLSRIQPHDLFGESVRFQFFQCDEFERRGVRCFKIHRSGAVVIERALPASHAYAPFVAWLQSGKTPLRTRRDKVVSIEQRKIEKFLRHFHANRVKPNIFGTDSTKSIAIKSGHRVSTTTLQFSSQNIRRHNSVLLFSRTLVG